MFEPALHLPMRCRPDRHQGGFLAERFPARRIVPGGIGVYATANVLIATATAAVPLIVFRALAGLGSGVNQVAERLYVTQVTASARRAFANGVVGIGVLLGREDVREGGERSSTLDREQGLALPGPSVTDRERQVYQLLAED